MVAWKIATSTTFAVALVFVGSTSTGFSEELPGTWSTSTPLPQPRSQHAAIEFDGKIYAVAGSVPKEDGEGMQNDGASTLVEFYDTATHTWHKGTPLPRPLTHVGLAAVDDKIYSVGGFTANIHKNAQTAAFVFDPAREQWDELPPLPSPRGSVATVALNGKVHAIGGRDPNDRLQATHDVYDPENEAWSSAAPLPVARDHASIVVANGKIHVIGGRTGDYTDVTDHHHVYDPDSDSWSDAPPMPTPRSGMAATVYDDMIVVFGGECRDEKTFSDNEGYDLSSKRWKKLRPAEGRHGFGAATIGNRAYFVAGAHGCGGEALGKELLVFTMP